MKILLTGAHFTPAQATAEELKKFPSTKLIYIGRSSTREDDKTLSVESQVFKNLGVKFIPLTTGRIQKNFDIYFLLSLLKIPIGFIQAFYHLVKIKPDVIVSFGGYISVPVVICGWLLSIPIITHQQTLVPGLSNIITQVFAQKKAYSFNTNLVQDSKTIVVGNPIRKEVLFPKKVENKDLKLFLKNLRQEKLPLVLITAGNQGSHLLNETVGKIVEKLLNKAYVLHITGDSKLKDYENLNLHREKIKHSERYFLTKWVNASDYGFCLRNSNLAICRSGINTLYELAYFGVPAITIPIPFLYKDEQNENGKFFQRMGLAQIINQNNLSKGSLLARIERTLRNVESFKKKAKQSKSIINTYAAKILAQEIIILAQEVTNYEN